MEFLENQAIGLLAVGLPVIIVAIVFFFDYRKSQDKNRALIEVSKNLNDPEQIKDFFGSLEPKKTSALQLKRSGMSTLFVGIGLYLFGLFFLGHILRGVGALVACIGLGVLLSGYFFPDKEDQKA